MLAAEAMKMAGTQFFVHQMSDSLTQIIQDDPRHRRAWRKTEITCDNTRRIYCLPPGMATCYPRSVNRNIFYIIGVIVVIVIVLKVLGLF
jgi:ferric-dicitrate binding protein FerR (iron transport regulator)